MFHIVVYTVGRIRGVPNRIQRSVPDLSWATFRRANLSFSFILPSCVCIYVYTDSRYHWFQAVRVSVDITETRRGIRNRSSHLSQTRPRHDTSRISWDNRFISTPRIPFGNGTTDSFLGISRLRSGGKIGEDTDSISILFFSILFFFVISLWISEILLDSSEQFCPEEITSLSSYNETCSRIFFFLFPVPFFVILRG